MKIENLSPSRVLMIKILNYKQKIEQIKMQKLCVLDFPKIHFFLLSKYLKKCVIFDVLLIFLLAGVLIILGLI